MSPTNREDHNAGREFDRDSWAYYYPQGTHADSSFPGPRHAVVSPQQGRRGVGETTWSAILVIAVFSIAAIVWAGITTSQIPSGTVEDRLAREKVQTPAGESPAPADPAQEAPSGIPVRVPEFALWAPGTLIQTTDHYPQPGESFTAQSCTVAFSFSNAEGRNFAVTAGHCGREGELVWPTNASTAADYAREAGRFIYSGLYSEDAGDTDIGIIEITDPDRLMALVGAPIATGIAVEASAVGDYVCKTGGTTGYTCGTFEESNRVQIITTNEESGRETRGDIAAVCAAKGDSGGPVFRDVSGRATIIGVVSGTEAGREGEECYEGMANPKLMSYSNVDQVFEIIDRVVPDAKWVAQSW
ncbi:trypsin-like serine protease [Corynebacterium mayonis]|uniref:trypsin-like serine protease n=1 Tax=Corynebacterium mayonis TaxID=3062461 RepID=UPI0031407C0A